MLVYIPYLQTGGFQVVTSSYVVNVSQYSNMCRKSEARKRQKVGPVVEFRTGMGWVTRVVMVVPSTIGVITACKRASVGGRARGGRSGREVWKVGGR